MNMDGEVKILFIVYYFPLKLFLVCVFMKFKISSLELYLKKKKGKCINEI